MHAQDSTELTFDNQIGPVKRKITNSEGNFK